MPHRSFGTEPAEESNRDPITFDFGLWGEETFTVSSEPSFGAAWDLKDAPEVTPSTELEACIALATFLRKLLVPNDVPRFNAALHRIPLSQRSIIVDAAVYVIGAIAGFPIVPPSSSQSGRPTTTEASSGGLDTTGT